MTKKQAELSIFPELTPAEILTDPELALAETGATTALARIIRYELFRRGRRYELDLRHTHDSLFFYFYSDAKLLAKCKIALDLQANWLEQPAWLHGKQDGRPIKDDLTGFAISALTLEITKLNTFRSDLLAAAKDLPILIATLRNLK